MKAVGSFLASLTLAGAGGLFLGEFILSAMAGFPNRSGGGSWDLGPVLYPIYGLPGLFIAHGISFGVISNNALKPIRFQVSAVVGSLGFAGLTWAVALLGGYKG